MKWPVDARRLDAPFSAGSPQLTGFLIKMIITKVTITIIIITIIFIPTASLDRWLSSTVSRREGLRLRFALKQHQDSFP